jgi:hypothetical protein
MQPDQVPGRSRGGDAWVRLAVIFWVIVVGVVCVRSILRPRDRTLFTTWAGAGRDWETGHDLYRTTWEHHQDQFRYSPLVAITLIPFAHLPEGLGGAVWRLLNAAFLLGGFGWWVLSTASDRTLGTLARSASDRTPRGRRSRILGAGLVLSGHQLAVAFVLLLPLSVGSLNNGQPNPLVVGLLLIAAAAANRDRWWLAAMCVMLATSWKVYPLAIGLLMVAAYPRRFGPRLAVALAAGLLLPFFCQRWGYVVEQYRLWFARLGGDDRKDWPAHMAYRDLWLLLQVWNLHISARSYTLLQLATAGGVALFCIVARQRGLPRHDVLLAVIVLGCCWMTLLGPATESSTYVLLAPVLAWAVLESAWQAREGSEAAQTRWPARLRWLPGAAWWTFLLAVLAGMSPGSPRTSPPGLHPLRVVADALLGGHFPSTNQIHALGLHPLAALLLTAGCLLAMLRTLAAAPRGVAAPPAPPARAA